MSVSYVEELWSGRTGEDGITRERTYTRMFEVRTTSAGDDPTVAGGTSLLPRNGSRYPFDTAAYMIRIRPTQVDSDPTLWYVACEYSTKLPDRQARETGDFDPETGESKDSPTGRDPTSRPDNPLDRDTIWKVTHEKFTEVATHTWRYIPILNSADDPYDPPIEVQRSMAVVTVTRNYTTVKFDWLEQFVDAVNASKWMGRNKRTCKIDAIDYDREAENGVNFWKVVFRIIINPRTWDRFVLEQGYQQKLFIGGIYQNKKVRIQDAKTGAFPDKPSLLSGARDPSNLTTDNATPVNPNDGSNPSITNVGYPAVATDGTTGRGVLVPDGSAPFYSRWPIFPEKAFSLLGL